jgi:hypothetical protein
LITERVEGESNLIRKQRAVGGVAKKMCPFRFWMVVWKKNIGNMKKITIVNAYLEDYTI